MDFDVLNSATKLAFFLGLTGFFYPLERHRNDIENLMLLSKIQFSLSNVRFLTSF